MVLRLWLFIWLLVFRFIWMFDCLDVYLSGSSMFVMVLCLGMLG